MSCRLELQEHMNNKLASSQVRHDLPPSSFGKCDLCDREKGKLFYFVSFNFCSLFVPLGYEVSSEFIHGNLFGIVSKTYVFYFEI